ncbi:MAG: Histidine N-alpha-methyltransferase [Thermoleophilia bacterium]|nr:Histidine N-alpha-methyltransferase [Thermoleophilia bacterium]
MATTLTLDSRMDEDDLLQELRADVGTGLVATPRWLSPRWFYDATGSRLFDEITRLPEYYLFRAERSILERHAADIARAAGDVVLVELGSGYSTKTLLLLDALQAAGSLSGIVTLDVSEDALREAADALAERYPDAPLHAIVGDYTRHLDAVPPAPAGAGRMIVFLGSTIGNLIPDERRSFLEGCAGMLEPGELFLVGTDLVKSPGILEAAYDDAAGVTARFNRNILRVLEQRLGAELDVDAFEHEAWWSEHDAWVQVALRANRATRIHVPGLVDTEFNTGDPILTEVSSKFTPERVDAELDAAGFKTVERWFDDDGAFALTLARRR